MDYTLELEVGDWSRDGHNMSEVFSYLSNMNAQEVGKAFQKGTDKVGFNLTKDVCRGFEENNISEERLNKLRAMGFTKELEDGTRVLPEDFADMYVAIAMAGEPGLFIRKVNGSRLHIGGYGLFNI